MMHDGADTINADPGICGLAVPKPPTQALDLLDDHRFRSGALGTMRRQAAGDLRQMLQPHGNVKPIQNRGLGDTSVEEDAPQPGTAVGEGRQHRRVGASDVLRLRRISAARSVSVFATAPNTCLRPVAVSTLPIRTSTCRSPASQLRMKVESKVTTIASDGVAGSAAATSAITSDGYCARFSTVPVRSFHCFPHARQRKRL